MIRTIYFHCDIPKITANVLNAESGRIYTQVMIEQYRIYRKKGIWLSPNSQERLNDCYNASRPSILHSHSIDAAQQGFSNACKTTREACRNGFDAKYPHKRKYYRTTIWKKTGIRFKNGEILLSLARGLHPLRIALPDSLKELSIETLAEVRLVYNKTSRHYEWHLVVDDGLVVQPTTNNNIAAIDLGEIHPVTITDGSLSAVISCRELRSAKQHTNKRLAKFQKAQSRHKKNSRRWKKLQQHKSRFLDRQRRRIRDIEHKTSHEVMLWAKEQQIGTLVIGDVRTVSNGKRLSKKSQQKISNWSHGKMRTYIGYKVEGVGIAVVDNIDEAYTSQTCACCGNRHKPKGRVYTCPTCGSIVHRDVQGAANILSRFLYNDLAKVPVVKPKYRYPVLRGKRSSLGHSASCSVNPIKGERSRAALAAAECHVRYSKISATKNTPSGVFYFLRLVRNTNQWNFCDRFKPIRAASRSI